MEYPLIAFKTDLYFILFYFTLFYFILFYFYFYFYFIIFIKFNNIYVNVI